VLCYQDETMLLGGDDLDRAERLDEPRQSLKIAEITKRLGDKLRQLWQLGYQVDNPIPCSRKRWKELTIVLSGGGTRSCG